MNQQGQSRFRLPVAEGMLLLVAIFWGTSYGMTKEALAHTTVLCFLAIRFFLTTFFLFPLYLKDSLNGLAKDWRYAIPTGLILLSIFLAETYGVFNTSASNAAFLISLCVLITPFIEWAVYRTYPGGKILLLAAASLIGVYFLTYDDAYTVQLNRGDYFILLAAFLRGVMVVATKVLMKNRTLSSVCLTALQSGVVATGAIVLLLVTADLSWELIPQESGFWVNVIYLVLFCTIFAFFAQNYGVRNTSASKVSLLMGSEPAFGALFAYYWLGETLSATQWLGGTLILAATIIATVPIRTLPKRLALREEM